MYEFGEPPARLSCHFCRSWRVSVDIGNHGEPDIKITHFPRCRTRRNPVLRKRAELEIIGSLYESGVFIPDYCVGVDGGLAARHRYLQAAT